ncbi:zwei Ig domain protein zig-3 [Tetranychus urticae]|uniref:Ig-like domain-containing protein n=1 Tax=Tetranychus urticae TaxID=32264 RepID=T1KTT8_TETUR|nr:zwei Ig domain protein zig-3 [Tetranychus urticae]
MFIGLIVLVIISLAAAKPFNPKLDSSAASESRPKHVKSRREPYVRWQHEPASNLILIAGQKHTIECEAAGSPPPKIIWLKNGQRINMDDQAIYGNSDIVDTSETPELGLSITRSKLYLGCVKPEDTGLYTCVADNNHEKIIAESQIKVLPSLKSSPFSSYTECTANELKKPQIAMWTHTRIENLDSPVILFCRTDGRTEAQIKWINSDGRELTPFTVDGKYDILSNGDLLIRKVTWDDMGSYYCVAENQYGQDKIESFLYPSQPDKQ